MGLFKNLLGTVLDEFRIGRGNASDKYLYANVRDTNRPNLRWNDTAVQWEFSNDGTSWTAMGSGGGGGLAYGLLPIAVNEATDQSGDIVVGALGITGADLGSADVKFTATAYVANSGLTGAVKLYNLSDTTLVTSLSFTELLSTKKLSATLSLNAGAKIYEVRISVTGGSVPADVIACMWAGLELSI